MLTKYDELTCHQAPTTFDHVGTSDRAWTEKLWMNIHDTQGAMVLALGFGVYPNRNVQDGYACLNLGNRVQTNLRLSRELRPRLDELSVGPLTWEVLEPYRRIRARLAENPMGLAFELEFLGRFQAGEEQPHFGRSRGRVFVNHCRYAQLGRAQGWVRLGDQRIELDPSRHYAQRDHSWGIRMGVGAPEQGVQAQDIDTFSHMLINWATLQFEDRALNAYLIEKADGRVERLTGKLCWPLGDPRPPAELTAFEHDWVYHPGSARMQGGQARLAFEDGTRLAIDTRELTSMYLRGGGYVGVKGFTHGSWQGPDWSDGERWEVGTPAVADEVHGLDDTVVECHAGGQLGYGIVENMILGPFPRYGFESFGLGR
ncbi:MAG TPA: hypothetical protein PK668_15945 [Myxococcota bacterium]|nr:hypothetical protein [Myxococcota bacterium]HRY94389.1 hypothetical protein [Myxococcota bacterium]HSA19997.1 hypothetical protein [Myxococcota bacterium]